MNYEYKKGYWETKDHQLIKIKDMETSHIENTIKYLKKHPFFYDRCYFDNYTINDDFIPYAYVNNSDLVLKKIKELEKELKKRNESKVI